MMYEYMVLEDNTAIAHSEMKPDGTVKVYIEQPVNGGFKHVTCYLPKYEWTDAEGFTSSEMDAIRKTVENNAHLILEFSQKGGVERAAGF